MKNIFYWSPFTSKVATIKSVLNSAYAVNKYLNNKYSSYILDAVDEWSSYSKEINNKKLKVIKLNNKSIFNKYKKEGFLRSRIAYLYIFFKSLIPLHKFLKDKKPSFLIIHLITSLPLFLFILNKYETKLILRISGLPKMNFLRKTLWKLAIKKIHKITCPTEDTYKDLSKYEFLKNKLILLRDPVINIFDIKKNFKKKDDIFYDKKINLINKDYILSIGRFTKQKNFIFYLKCIPKILNLKKDLYFVFIGQGENKKIILRIAKKLNILDRILIIKNTENVHYYMKKSSCFVSTSLWEDPGFVLVEAGFNNCLVISSDCPNGPKEIIGQDGGYLFNSNNKDSFVQVFEKFLNDTPEAKYLKKVALKKRVKKFTLYHHIKLFPEILGCS